MTVETLYFVLRYGGILQQVSNAVCACEWVAVPSDRRRRTVEFRQVCDPRWGVVRGVIQAGELVCSTGRDFDAVGISEPGCEMNEAHSYSSRVRVLILFESCGPNFGTYLLERVGKLMTEIQGDYSQIPRG